MLPILLVLGATGALLEIQRLVNRPPQDGDALKLKQSEERLRKVLREVQQELHRTQAEQQRDHKRAEELQKTADELRKAEAELRARSQELHSKALGLNNEVQELQQEVKSLQDRHHVQLQEESSKHEQRMDELKRGVASLFEEFSDNKIAAADLVDKLQDMGVEVHVAPEEFKALPTQESSGSRRPRQLELSVDADFKSQLRLVSDCPERMARLVAEGARNSHLLQSGASEKAFPTVKTPPSVRRDVSLFSSRGRIPTAVQAIAALEDKENASRQPLADVTPRQKQMNSPQSAQMPKKGTAGKKSIVPKLSLAKATKQSGKDLANRESFALTDLAVDCDISPVMRHTSLSF